MTLSRLFPSTAGPAAPVSYSGPFIAGVLFEVTQGGMWFEGYWIWVPAAGDTTTRICALWNVTGNGTGELITAANIPSTGPLLAGQWNFVPLAVPVQLAIGTTYNACNGYEATLGFPDSDTGGDPANSFGPGGHDAGITEGPLFAFSDTGGSAAEPYGNVQGVFSAAGTDPRLIMPAAGSNSANFWMDLQVSTIAPAGFTGQFRLWPTKFDANPATVPDSAVNYVVATEVHLSAGCLAQEIFYYSPPGTDQLATAASVWAVTGAATGTLVAGSAAPSWSGAAGSGWVGCPITAVKLPAGIYKVSVFNDAAVPDEWSAKDANTAYWDTGAGAAGIVNGPLSAPGLAAASLAFIFDGAAGGSVPPFTTGVTERGQCTFAQPTVAPGPDQYPYLYVDGLAQNYWVDLGVSLAPPPGGGGRALGGSGDGRSAFRRRLIW